MRNKEVINEHFSHLNCMAHGLDVHLVPRHRWNLMSFDLSCATVAPILRSCQSLCRVEGSLTGTMMKKPIETRGQGVREWIQPRRMWRALAILRAERAISERLYEQINQVLVASFKLREIPLLLSSSLWTVEKCCSLPINKCFGNRIESTTVTHYSLQENLHKSTRMGSVTRVPQTKRHRGCLYALSKLWDLA